MKIPLASGYVVDLDDGQVFGEGELRVLNEPCRREEPARYVPFWPE